MGNHGIRLNGHKNTVDCKPVAMPVPAKVRIPLALLGANTSTFLVQKGDEVAVGQPVATQGQGIGVPVYASVSGKVAGIETVRLASGAIVDAVVIESDGRQTPWEGIKPPVVEDLKSFLEAVRQSGVVGLGGAGFPTWVKLNAEVEYLIINGSECEPYCTADYIALRDFTADVVEGVRLVKEYGRIPKVIIGVKHPPQGIEEAFKAITGAEIKPLQEYYPVGAERMLIKETTGRVIPGRKLPKDVGCIVLNVNTAAYLARYLRTGMPLVSRTVTVDGSAVNTPSVITAPIGTPVGDIFEAAGGFKCEPAKILAGGPMMGVCLPNLDFPLLWQNGSFLALDAKDAKVPDSTACIRCGRCVDHCPMNLMAFQIGKAYEARDLDTLKKIRADLCIECGCCAYVCPAKRDMVTANKLAKRYMADEARKEANK